MFFPMLMMVILTAAVACVLLLRRIQALKQREVTLGYFRLNRGEQAPAKLIAATNHFSNLFEVPVLFYVAGTLSIVLNYQTLPMQILAWIFVVSRVCHAVIHLGSNNVKHRMPAFAVGVFCVLALWGLLALHLLARGTLA